MRKKSKKIAVDKMTKAESIAVGFSVGILCPLLLFILFWWVAAVLFMYQILPITENGIAVVAFVGLALGIILDVIYLKRWIPHFYRFDLRMMILVYLCCSVIAVALFMGLPIGNLILGALAGVYIGRREHHAAKGREAASIVFRNGSLFTAIVTGVEAFPIGVFALQEDWLIEWLQGIRETDLSVVTGIFSIGVIILLCIVLMIIQFWCTRTMAWIAFGRK
jgi:hypothetical protein